MKKFFASILLTIVFFVFSGTASIAATTLTAGDIVIVAINGDADATNNLDRGFSFMPLVDLEEGTVINFTDYGWSDLTSAFITNTGIADAFIHYTTPAGGITAGTIIRCDSYRHTNFTFDYAYSGTGSNNYLNIAGLSQGDELLVFTGTRTAPTFIFAASIVSTTIVAGGWATNVGTNGTDGSGAGSALPPGLTDDVTALSFNQAAAANDNASYSGDSSAATKAVWKDRIKTIGNWTFNDASPIPPLPVGPFTVTETLIVTTGDFTTGDDVAPFNKVYKTKSFTFTQTAHNYTSIETNSGFDGFYSYDYSTANGTEFTITAPGYSFDLTSFKYYLESARLPSLTITIKYIDGSTDTKTYSFAGSTTGVYTFNTFTTAVNDVISIKFVTDNYMPLNDFDIVDIKPLPSKPTVSTTAVSTFNTNSATMGGNVTADGGATVSERGVVYSLASANTDPQIGGSGVTKVAIGSGTGAFSQSVGSLNSGTQYYVNAYAINTSGTSYGTATNFTTSVAAVAATVTTNAASAIATTGATLNGTVNANGSSTAVTFEYGLTTGYGTTVTAVESPVTGNSATSVSKAIAGLSASTAYHYRVVGVNGAGTTNGSDVTFTTAPAAPSIAGISAGTFNTNQIFTVNGEAGATIEYSTNNGGLWTAYTGAVTISAEGTYNVLARQTNLAGSGPTSSVAVTFTIDKTAPAAPTISGISAGYFKTNQSFTVSGEAGATIEYSINNGGLWTAYAGAVALSSERTYNVLARQTDLAGNGPTSSTAITLTIDKTSPAAPSISGISAGTYNSNQTFSVSGEAGASIEYSTNNGGLWTAYAGAVTISAEGTYNVLARQTDQAGNGPVSSAAITLTIDKSAPAAPTISGIAAGSFNTNQTFSLSGEAGATIEYSTNNGGLWTAYTGAVTISAEGTYNVLARQTDLAGNGPTSSAAISLTIDKTAPAAPTISGISAGSYTANQTFTVSGEAGATIEYSVNNGGLWTAYAGAVTLSVNATYNVLARQTDLAGNGPVSSAVITFTIDKNAPTTQASTIVFSSVALSQMTIGWTNGNGTSRSVFVKAANSGTASPVDNDTYTANTLFTTGTQIALSGWYCVYNGTGTSVTVTGLSSGTDYIAHVIEYKGTSGSEIYNTSSAADNPKSQATLMVAPTNLSYAASPVVATINTTNISASPTVTGTVVSYSISPALPTGVSLNTSTGVISGTPSALLAQTDFTVTATNTGGSTNGSFRLTVSGFAPTVTTQAVTDISSTTATGNGNITNLGVPNPTQYGVVWNTAANPTTALTTKTTQGAAGATGAFTSNITNLSPWTTYYVKAYATNTEGTSYGTEVSFTTSAIAASTQASDITSSAVGQSQFTITWTNGNGAKRAVFVKDGTGAITNPSDNSTYTASNDWNVKGTQLGASGYFCIYNNTGNTVTLTNLLPSTLYTIQIFEYNGLAGGEKYNLTTAANNPKSQITAPIPPVATAATLINSFGFNANWNPAAGASSYQLDVATDNGFANIVSAYNGFDVGNVTTYAVTGLSGATRYYYRLRSVNTGGAGTNSNFIDVLTNQAIIAKDTTVTPNSFIVKWDPVSDAVDYFLDYSTENNFTGAVSSPNPNPLVLEKENNSASTSSSYITIAVGNTTSFLLTGLGANTTYYYRVRAANSLGIIICTSNPLSTTTGIQSVNNSRYTLTAPGANTRWQSGTFKYIEWKRSGIIYGTILLEYSIDGGENWIKINTQPIAGASRYPWLVPNTNSTNCLIRMTNYVTHSLFDITGSFFEIYTASAEAVNYPNPFNPSTKIKFSIESKGDVLLKVYNSLGEEVAVLVNGELEAGAHEYEFNAAKLTSGIYFYNLRVNGYSETHKMLLIK